MSAPIETISNDDVLTAFRKQFRYRFQTLVRFISYYSSFSRFDFWSGIALSVLKAPVYSGVILYSGYLIDSLVEFYEHPKYIFHETFSFPFPIVYLLLTGGLWVIDKALSLFINLFHTRLKYKAFAGGRQDTVEHFSRLNLQDLSGIDVKDDLAKIETYWWDKSVDAYQRIQELIEMFVRIAIAVFIMMTYNPLLAIVVMLLPLPEIIITAINNQRARNFLDDVSGLVIQRNYLYDVLTDIRTFAERKINAIYHYLEVKFLEMNKVLMQGYQYVDSAGDKYETIAGIIDIVALHVVKIVFVLVSLFEKIAVGRIIYILGYIDDLYNGIFSVQLDYVTLLDDLAFIEKQFDFMDRNGFADKTHGHKTLQKGTPSIELRNFSFKYPVSEITVLENVNLKIKPGEKILVLGKDGSGKSSLTRIISALYEVKEGEILYNDISVKKLRRREVKSKISLVTEDFGRYHMSLKENIILGDPDKKFDPQLYAEALRIADLTEWAEELNIDHDNTMIGGYHEGSVEISSGHWQRIAIARAIYRNRDIFILDQPFANIDSASVNKIFPELFKFLGQRTVIMIGEEALFMHYFTHIHEMENHTLRKLSREEVKTKWVI